MSTRATKGQIDAKDELRTNIQSEDNVGTPELHLENLLRHARLNLRKNRAREYFDQEGNVDYWEGYLNELERIKEEGELGQFQSDR